MSMGSGLAHPHPLFPRPNTAQNDCGEAVFKRSDGTGLPLNCAGPRHAYFRRGPGGRRLAPLAALTKGWWDMFWRRPCGSSAAAGARGRPSRCAPRRDADGTLLGGAAGATVLGRFDGPHHATLQDQGPGAVPGPCSWSPDFAAYVCRRACPLHALFRCPSAEPAGRRGRPHIPRPAPASAIGPTKPPPAAAPPPARSPGAATTQLTSGWLPSPLPPAGIWGDPQLMVLESRRARGLGGLAGLLNGWGRSSEGSGMRPA
jgi:hypothetical protein